jgi:hypothetical protein
MISFNNLRIQGVFDNLKAIFSVYQVSNWGRSHVVLLLSINLDSQVHQGSLALLFNKVLIC